MHDLTSADPDVTECVCSLCVNVCDSLNVCTGNMIVLPILVQCDLKTFGRATMQSWRAFLVLGTLLLLAVMANMACAAYRKPPFNGSIFGKRSRGQLGHVSILLLNCVT
ncbi:hypothetical protein MRX96_029793 [Rhipicephalus microplus]